MNKPRGVLYFAENALSAIQGGGIVAYAVLKGLPAEQLLGFYTYRNITPVPEYAHRFTYLGEWRTPKHIATINRLTGGRTTTQLHRRFTEAFMREDFGFVQQHIARSGFVPEVVYFSGLSYRLLRLAVMAAEHYDLPMLLLHMDDWMEVERREAGRFGDSWYRRIVDQMQRAAARSLASTSNSPRLADRLTAMTGYRHVTANNCCSDLLAYATPDQPATRNEIPVITYAGAMNQHLQGETVKILASAVTEMNAEGTPVHLHIYTPWEFAPQANSITVPNAVFYKGQVGRERLADIFLQSDFLVTTVTHREANIPLFRHSLSTKLSEYLCAGRPVISMGHYDWHMHEYVQEHGCGFSIPMDEHYSRSAIKEQLRRMLATPAETLADIGRRNRELWARAHEVTTMARTTRRAVRLDVGPEPAMPASAIRRGALWVGGPGADGAEGWVPANKLKAIGRRLVDVYEHTHVDVVGPNAAAHPAIESVLGYCRDIGLRPTVVNAGEANAGAWEPAGARWSLSPAQKRPDGEVGAAPSVFAQVAALRGASPRPSLSPAQRAVNQLTVRVDERAATRPVVWAYGSTAIGLEVLQAIRAHGFLGQAVEIGGFVSSPGHRSADTLHGERWVTVDELGTCRVDFVLVTSETSRLAIQQELSRAGLRDRIVPLYGYTTAREDVSYERVPGGPGQQYRDGASARDYATSELVARTADHSESRAASRVDADRATAA